MLASREFVLHPDTQQTTPSYCDPNGHNNNSRSQPAKSQKGVDGKAIKYFTGAHISFGKLHRHAAFTPSCTQCVLCVYVTMRG